MNYTKYQEEYKIYETKLRHIICIFLSLETLLICLFILIVSLGDGEIWKLIKYHEKQVINFIAFPLIFYSIITAFTVLSYKYKSWFIIYEGIHILLGGIFLIISVFSLNILGLLICFILSWRFIAYQIIIQKYTNKTLYKNDYDEHDEELQSLCKNLDIIKNNSDEVQK